MLSHFEKPSFLKEPTTQEPREIRKALTLISLRSKGRNCIVSDKTESLSKLPYIRVLAGDVSPLAKLVKLGYDSYLNSSWKCFYKSIRVLSGLYHQILKVEPIQVGWVWYIFLRNFLRMNIRKLRKLRDVHFDQSMIGLNPARGLIRVGGPEALPAGIA
jgi:hypothetical protein